MLSSCRDKVPTDSLAWLWKHAFGWALENVNRAYRHRAEAFHYANWYVVEYGPVWSNREWEKAEEHPVAYQVYLRDVESLERRN